MPWDEVVDKLVEDAQGQKALLQYVLEVDNGDLWGWVVGKLVKVLSNPNSARELARGALREVRDVVLDKPIGHPAALSQIVGKVIAEHKNHLNSLKERLRYHHEMLSKLLGNARIA